MHLPRPANIFEIFLRSIVSGCLIAALGFAALAASPAEYAARLDKAKTTVDTAIQQVPFNNRSREDEFSKALVKLVPPTEKIEWRGGEVETSNGWLTEALSQFRSTDVISDKRTILQGISERLEGISDGVKALNSAAPASSSKDQEKQKLGEILRRPEYQRAEAGEESLFHKLWRQFWEWFDNVFPSMPKVPDAPAGIGGLKSGLQILIFAAVLGLIGFLLYKFAPGILGRFGGKPRESRGDRVILGENVRADQSSSDLFSEADRLARAGDLRGAIRKGYIAVLCELGDRNILRLASYKTNRDYLRDVRKNNDLYGDMAGLTGTFERSWYGHAVAGEEDWEQFKAGYGRALRGAKGRA